ncbi:hypothetical protein, conserved [Trypanosoma brucei gambiense DAL972]|uniref:Uncharacterized protein n=1 Tax=Trypanosoma brucei gambiense (strain MHOM/CI/86/DAL972) TaxID=679716 RepID=C9ZKD5_TRYB9|nr:hypothetical protein, conserved [Trypanosoma brucei gambiense DAL972]CBH09899.1 hypothetical protein, conserved [Trypanosoma brucei gambiense DAL972]|eukprot:XP_011772192.1 hypothetical protein, conserved [Trypanosoma brucei gambiense DAL972]
MKILRDVYRQTFPKKLRFDKSSRILYAQIYVIARRHKHRKYIPKEDIEDVLNNYTTLPGSPWLQLPIIRHVLLIRQINGIRGFFGKRSWLLNRAVEEEFNKIVRWMNAQEQLVLRTGAGRCAANLVLREKFVKEVLDVFHVATAYQRMVRVGALLIVILLLLLIVMVNVDRFVYVYLVHWSGMCRTEVMEWFREITEQHTVAEVPPAYRSLLPPPCVMRVAEDGRVKYELKIAELVSKDENIIVLAVPCPQVGTKSFFAALGKTVGLCDAVLMEGVSFEYIDRIAPASLFPLRDDTFPALGVHHRFLDILRDSREPPFLYPAGTELSWSAYLQHLLIPFEVKCIYWPTFSSASKGEARVGWGRLRELIEKVTVEQERAQLGEDKKELKPYVICLPWTVNQIVNLEASLVKLGFRVRRVFPLEWIDRDHMGEHFCNYYSLVGE